MGDTPNIHLALAGDADEIRNWQILDGIIRQLGLRQIMPGDLIVQGNLEVVGATQLDGTLQVNGQSSLAVLSVANTATFLSAVGLNSALTVTNGPVSLPPGSIAPAALAPGSATTGVWIGTAQTTQLGITTSALVELANVATDANEDPARWSVVFGQATLRIEYGASGSAPNGTITMTIRRGATDVQQRVFTYDASQAPGDGMDIDIPFTMVRVAKPGDATNVWRLMAGLTQVGGGDPLNVLRTFAQVHCLQLR
jgi:hypothetical protein